MDELRDGEWQEVSRWIKFEEDLLEGAERWGRPHISSLTFHSVINLRLVLEQCKFSTTIGWHIIVEQLRRYSSVT